MGDDCRAVGDELLGVPLPFGLFGLQAENLKCVGGGAAHLGDGWTAASSEKSTVQGQSVVRICAIDTLKGCMDGIDGLLHLIRVSLFLGALGVGYCSAVQQPLVGMGVNVQPAGWSERQGIPSYAPLGSRCSEFFRARQQKPADLLFIC